MTFVLHWSFDLSCNYYLYILPPFQAPVLEWCYFHLLGREGITSFPITAFTGTVGPWLPRAVRRRTAHWCCAPACPGSISAAGLVCGLPVLDHHGAAAWSAFCHLFSIVLYSIIPHGFENDKWAALRVCTVILSCHLMLSVPQRWHWWNCLRTQVRS